MGSEGIDRNGCECQMEIENIVPVRKLTHLSLFSGIGGLDLAAEWAGFKTVGQCEFADYPAKVLEKHWPGVPRWRDIHELQADEFVQRTGIRPGELTCISGGFPCQPHSAAGLRKASSDKRELWPEYRRVIGEIKPRWVVAENVRGLLSSEDGRFFRGILRDFSNLGYDVGWCCYRAADIGAVHSRERVAIVAHSAGFRWNRLGESKQNGYAGIHLQVQKEWACKENDLLLNVSRVFNKPVGGILRNDDGLSEGMDRIKCLGNAVVPQQFYPVFKVIAEIERGI